MHTQLIENLKRIGIPEKAIVDDNAYDEERNPAIFLNWNGRLHTYVGFDDEEYEVWLWLNFTDVVNDTLLLLNSQLKPKERTNAESIVPHIKILLEQIVIDFTSPPWFIAEELVLAAYHDSLL
jgi:hypothetical protein